MSNGSGIWKVMTIEDHKIAASTGFIPEQPADRGSKYIHACSHHLIYRIRERYYVGRQSVAVRIDWQKALAAGFHMVYEPSSHGIYYWHFYRPTDNLTALLPYVDFEEK